MATYDREWEPTRDLAEKTLGGGVLLGEFPLWTGRGTIRRRVDGVLIRQDGRFEAHQWKEIVELGESERWAAKLHRSRLVVIQTKLTTVGFAVLGQALFSKLLVEGEFRPATLEAVALVTGRDSELEDALASSPFAEVRVTVDDRYPARAPRMEPRRDAVLRQLYASRALRGWRCAENFPLTRFQKVEAVYVRGRPPPTSPADLAGRDVVLVHTSDRPHLDLLGHATLGALLVRRAGAASVSSRLVVRSDDPDLTAFLPMFPDVELRLPGNW